MADGGGKGQKKQPPVMAATEEQREQLAKLMDKELGGELKKLENKSKKYVEGWTEENWEEEMEKHPLFASKGVMDDKGELNPLIKGLQDLKYSPEENTPLELAYNYKEDGNFNFKCKKYSMAVLSYTEGLKHLNGATGTKEEKEEKEEQTALPTLKKQLMANRAAAQFHLGNYRSSLIDSRIVLKVYPDHIKSLLRAVQCSEKLERFPECIQWCDVGLALEEEDDSKKKEFLEYRARSEKRAKEQERNKRKEAILRKKAEKESKALLEAIGRRGIQLVPSAPEVLLEEPDEGCGGFPKNLIPVHPMVGGKQVHIVSTDDGAEELLAWPVLIIYPESGQMDLVEEFVEGHRFKDHLNLILGDEENRPPWDSEGKYCPDSVNLYFEGSGGQLVSVEKEKTLGEVLSDQRYLVASGTPTFIVLAGGSKFESKFLGQHCFPSEA